MSNRLILLNPGPVVLSERVRKAMLEPDLCHREDEFISLQNGIRQALLDIYQLPNDAWAAILIAGSGTAAMEAMLVSLVPATGKLLVLENGAYGERLCQIAERQGLAYRVLHHAWGERIQLDRLEAVLQRDKQISHIAAVHHETSSGRLNALDKIAKISQRAHIPLLVDAISSFAAEELCFQKWGIAACAATANKCIHGIPGTAFVIVDRAMLPQPAPARSLYLDLHAYLACQDKNSTPFTPAVHSLYALKAALDELVEGGGWRARNTVYWQKMDKVRSGLRALGMQAYLEKKYCSSVLSAFYLPQQIGYQQLHDQLKKAGFVIYAGQGKLQNEIFRISCMGEIETEDIDRLLACTAAILHDKPGGTS